MKRQSHYLGLIHKYSSALPVKKKSDIVSLCEGNTPLLRATRLEEALKLPCKLYLKYEGLNPTGSFKDRGMTYAVTKAKEDKAKAIICASTGNTSASAAAYAAKAKIKCFVLIPQGNIAYGKLSQAMIHGAEVVQIKGNFDQSLDLVRELGANFPVHVVNSINPFRLLGQQTASFEICEALGVAPSYHFLPVGNAGNITAYWMGYRYLKKRKKIKRLPKMMGFQAAGAAPIVLNKVVSNPKTVATAIRIGNPASWKGAITARDESGGEIDKVNDSEIVQAYQMVARLEGYFCEPASATSIAGVIKEAKRGRFTSRDVVVCTLTGHGLKDPDIAIKNSIKPYICEPKLNKLVQLLKLGK